MLPRMAREQVSRDLGAALTVLAEHGEHGEILGTVGGALGGALAASYTKKERQNAVRRFRRLAKSQDAAAHKVFVLLAGLALSIHAGAKSDGNGAGP